jgi:hypothetical protein
VFVIVPSYLGTIIAKLLKGRLIGSTENRKVILEKKRDFGEVDEIGACRTFGNSINTRIVSWRETLLLELSFDT